MNRIELEKALDQLVTAAEERGYHGELSSIGNKHLVQLKTTLDKRVSEARERVISISEDRN